MSKIKLLLDVVQDMENLAESLKTLAEAIKDGEENTAEPVQAAEPVKELVKAESVKAEAVKAIPFEEVRRVLAEKSSAGKTAEVKAILEKHGAARLSAVDPSEYAQLLEEVNAI